jgi:hypothetical protein
MDGSVAMGCTVPAFRPCSGTCFTVSATQGLPRTMVAHTVSSGRGRCEVHVYVTAHPSDPGMTAWFTTATSDDLNDTLERAAH